MNAYESCTLCGFCRRNCCSYITTLNEKYSARGRAIFLKKGKTDESFYRCTLCLSCIKECPADVNLDLRRMRIRLVNKGIELEGNKKMIENIRNTGNPFGR